MPQRNDQFTFRVSPEEKANLEAEAASLDRPVSWLIRHKVFPPTELRSHSTSGPATSNTDAVRTTGTFTVSEPWTDPQPPDTTGAPVPKQPAPSAPSQKNAAQTAQAARDQILGGVTRKKK